MTRDGSVWSTIRGASAVTAQMTSALEIERRPLGATPLTIPRVALGCGNFGGVGSAPAFFGQGLSEDEAFALMDTAWELGITHFDTADAYGGGRSETMIGHWIEARGVVPQLTTKTYNPMDEGADHGLGAHRLERQLRSSLERLGVERVDLFLAHEFDPDVPLEETLGVLAQARQKRRIGAYGVSNFDAAQLVAALKAGTPAAIQNSHSLLDRADESDVLPLCAAQGVAYCAFSPLAGGWLTGKYRRGEPFPAGSRMTQRPEPYEPLVAEKTYDGLEALQARASERGHQPRRPRPRLDPGRQSGYAGRPRPWPARAPHAGPGGAREPAVICRADRADEGLPLMRVLVLSHGDIVTALPPGECAEAMAAVLSAHAPRGDLHAAAFDDASAGGGRADGPDAGAGAAGPRPSSASRRSA